MGVLSDDFAAVDLREELCYHSRPKEAKFKRNTVREKSKKESHARRKKREPVRSGSAGTAPHRRAFRFGFPRCLFSWRVLVAAAHQRRRSRIKDKHTPRLQKQYKQLKVRLKTHENGAYIIFEIADKLLKFKCIQRNLRFNKGVTAKVIPFFTC